MSSDRRMPFALAACLVVWAAWCGNVPAQDDAAARQFLARHCVACHGAEKPKGGLRLDRIESDFSRDADREHWQTVVKRVAAGEMPPKAKPRPGEEEVRALTGWVAGKVKAAEAARR